MFEADTWPKCFLDFFYGDAVPNMPNRGLDGTGTVYITMEEIFAWLQDREELEYTLPSETTRYKARATSRFDTPEMTAMFGSVLRHILILRGVGTVFRREGYEADLRQIANAKAEDCVAALCGTERRSQPSGAAKPAVDVASRPSTARSNRPQGQSIDQLANNPNVPENLRKALRQVLFVQVKVPFTDGYRKKLRHEGHNLNAVLGPLKIFATANFADVHSPVMLSLLLATSAGEPLANPIEIPWPAGLAEQCPSMCTLQEMHRLIAESPRTQAKFWLLMDDLVDRYLFGIEKSYIGKHTSNRPIHDSLIEDDACSSGDLGLAGFALHEMEPLEAQARGFTHGHRKVYGVPEPLAARVLQEFQETCAAKPGGMAASSSVGIKEFFAGITRALIECAATLQYEAATLPATQLLQPGRPEKFTPRQQELSRLDGGMEIDGTTRDMLETTPDEPLGHIVAEQHKAILEGRPERNAYRDVPLTGCNNSLLPHYRLPQNAFQPFPVLDEFGCHDASSGDGQAALRSSQGPLPWTPRDGGGAVTRPVMPSGAPADNDDVVEDAHRWAQSFTRDVRALHCHNHDHNCSFTCVKYVQKAAKKLAEAAIGTTTSIVCRFFFFVVLTFTVIENGVQHVRRVRRRGKKLVPEAHIATTNEHNELGRVQVVRRTPFRSPTSDVAQAAVRCNFDYQFMARAPVFAPAGDPPPEDRGDVTAGRASAAHAQLAYEKAESFYGIKFCSPDADVLREAARSMLAMWQAAHNTDYYITKYGTKALEQLQNLIGQFALGLRRLELQEEQENDARTTGTAALQNQQTYKQRARRVTLRMAMAANRATWCSCCEMALFIRTGAHVRKTYFPRDLYLSRIAFLCHACNRLLHHDETWVLEASERNRFGTTDMSTLVFQSEKPSAERRKSILPTLTDKGNDDEDTRDPEAEADDKEEDDAMLVQMRTLRQTTSTHDDWLHRGPYLRDLPFHTYAEYVDRVRVSRNSSHEQQLFKFQPHYVLSKFYCQRIKTPARVPVLEALRFMPPGEGTREDNALYKHIVGSITECTCTDGCSDPLLFKPFMFKAGSAEKPGPWRFCLAWKARRAELEVLARRAERKTQRARRVPCILDTTLVRGWAPRSSAGAPSLSDAAPPMLRATLAQLGVSRFGTVWPDAFGTILLFMNASNVHPDQLTLAEFAAFRTRALVQNLDMMAVARTVRLTQASESKGQTTDEPRDLASASDKYQQEFMGGEHDDNKDDAELVEEELLQTAPALHAKVSLDVANKILQREHEIAAANRPGRHREADVQMKEFAAWFGESLTAPMPRLSSSQPTTRGMSLLGRSPQAALAHQSAVRTAMRKNQDDLKADAENATEEQDVRAMLEALENLRMDDREAMCDFIPVPDLMKGPKHVAESIMREQAAEGRVLNDEQKNLYALWVQYMQDVFLLRPDADKHLLPLQSIDGQAFDIIIDGGGGCGKSMLINHFFVPLCRAFYNHAGVILGAPTNKAARGIHGKTLHGICGFTPDTCLRTSALALTTQKRVKLERTCLPAGVVIEDEFSMISGTMNHAASLLFTYARETQCRLRRGDYAMRGERYGRVPMLAWAGDHLQLPPVPKKNSLLAPLENTSQEHRVGASIFRSARYVFQLNQMMRFDDPVLIRILRTMRVVGGKPLSESDWNALLNTEKARYPTSSDGDESPVPAPALPNDWFHTAYVWSVVAMAAYVVARQSARQACETLVYVQAVDVLANYQAPSATKARELYRAILRMPNLTKTKRLPAFCLLHVGMEVRLTTTLDMPYAVQDAIATVLEIVWDSNDASASLFNRSVEKPAEIMLDHLPHAVIVRLHDCKQSFLPCAPCDECGEFCEECERCKTKRTELQGVFAVQPLQRTWKYDGPELEGQHVNVSRRQLPLAPARVLPLYSMQGMTARPGLVAHWTLPPRLDGDLKWLICYVILSRPPSLAQLIPVGL